MNYIKHRSYKKAMENQEKKEQHEPCYKKDDSFNDLEKITFFPKTSILMNSYSFFISFSFSPINKFWFRGLDK